MGAPNEERSPEAIYLEIGRAITQARQSSGMTQEDLANPLGLSRTSVTNIEAGRQRLLVHTLLEIAGALSVPVTELLPKRAERREDAEAPALEIKSNVELNDSERSHVVNVIRKLTQGAD